MPKTPTGNRSESEDDIAQSKRLSKTFTTPTMLESDLFRSVIESLNDGVIVWHNDGSVVLSNQAASDMLGFNISEMFSPGILADWAAIDVDDNAVSFHDFPARLALKTGQPVLGKINGLKYRGGPTRWIETDAYPLFLPGGKQPHGVMSIGRDVTKTVTAINALSSTQRRTEIILAKSGNRFRIVDWYGNVIEAVPPMLRRGVFDLIKRNEGEGLAQPSNLGSSQGRIIEVFERIREQYLATETHEVFVSPPIRDDWWCEFSMTNHLDDPAVGGIVINYRDVTQRHNAEKEIRFQADLLARTGQAFVATDNRGHIVFWNQTAVEIFGWTAEDAHDRHITDVITSEDDSDAIAEYCQATTRCNPWSGDLTIRRRNGTSMPIATTSTPVFDADGDFIAVVGVSTDITERKASEVALAELAFRDPLTGLPNRPMLVHEIEAQLEAKQSSAKGFAVLFIGLDRFKVINEGTSHTVGDRILQLVGDRLTAAFPDDVVARFGGDEFVVLHGESTELIVETSASQVIDEFRRPFKIFDHDLVVSASIGISYASDEGTADSLLRDANSAMHEAKRAGRSQSRTYDNRSRKRAKERLNTELGLRTAIDRGELFVEYQPIVTLSDHSIAAVEALVRWEHPLLGRIGPDRFIPVAEETGLIIPLGRLVLNEALRQKVEWARDGVVPNATITVNLSPRQLLDPTLVTSLEAAIAESGIAAQQLTLEITENSLMHDIDLSITVLERLKEMGLQLAVDDFGTGHSSMTYLKRLPIDILKIDRSFVANLGTDRGNSSIVRAISSLGEALDLAVVAEGVETQTQLAALGGQHCSYGQGYFWSPSLGGPELATWATTAR